MKFDMTGFQNSTQSTFPMHAVERIARRLSASRNSLLIVMYHSLLRQLLAFYNNPEAAKAIFSCFVIYVWSVFEDLIGRKKRHRCDYLKPSYRKSIILPCSMPPELH